MELSGKQASYRRTDYAQGRRLKGGASPRPSLNLIFFLLKSGRGNYAMSTLLIVNNGADANYANCANTLCVAKA